MIACAASRFKDAPATEIEWTPAFDLASAMPDLDYVYHPSFSLPITEARLFGASACEIAIPQWTDFFAFGEDAPVPAVKSTMLKGQEEKVLFLRYNYSRYRLAKLTKSKRSSPARTEQTEVWRARAMKARTSLVQANMALVLAMAKRQRAQGADVEDLIAEGNMALLRCVDKFDVAYGFKFSTYACRAILKSFYRLSTKTVLYRQRFPVSYVPEYDRPGPESPKQEIDIEESVAHIRKVLAENKAKLTEMETVIITERFALASRAKGKTLSEISGIAGLSIERVRQILNQAMTKIRLAMDPEMAIA